MYTHPHGVSGGQIYTSSIAPPGVIRVVNQNPVMTPSILERVFNSFLPITSFWYFSFFWKHKRQLRIRQHQMGSSFSPFWARTLIVWWRCLRLAYRREFKALLFPKAWGKRIMWKFNSVQRKQGRCFFLFYLQSQTKRFKRQKVISAISSISSIWPGNNRLKTILWVFFSFDQAQMWL